MADVLPIGATGAHPEVVALRDLIAVLGDRLAPPAELLTRDTFAELLAIGLSTFDRLRETGGIGPRHVRLAGLKWHRDEVLAWLRQRTLSGDLYDASTWPAVWATLRRHS